MERTMMLGFRKGFVEEAVFHNQYGVKMEDAFGDILDGLQERGYLLYEGGGYRLTRLGRYHQGNVSAEFMRSTFGGTSALKKKMAISMHIVPEAL